MISAPAPAHMRLVVSHQPDREDREEFYHRMKVNCLAAAAIVVLLTIGIWLANAMVEAKKVQGCYVSGNHSCSLI
jgi:hypothetical protein